MRRRWCLLGAIGFLLWLGCAPHAWAQAANSLVSINPAGTDSGNNTSGVCTLLFPTHERSISDDGRFVVFGSFASNLVTGDGDSLSDIFVRDTCVGATSCTPSP